MEMIESVGTQAATSGRERRQNERYAKPFDGLRIGPLDMPLSLFDLSRGGCFVNTMHEQSPGVQFTMKIDLPNVGWITLKAETLYVRSGYGFAVRFVDVDEVTADRLDRALEQMLERAI